MTTFISKTNDRDTGDSRVLHRSGISTWSGSAKHSFIGVEVDFNSWNSSAIQDLTCFYLRYRRSDRFSHMVRLCSKLNRVRLGKQRERMKGIEMKRYDEENGIGGLCPNGRIDGVFDSPRERVFVQILLNRHLVAVVIVAVVISFCLYQIRAPPSNNID